MKHDSDATEPVSRDVARPSRGARGLKPPAREFPAYSVTLDGKALAVGEHLQVAPRVTFTRRC